MLYSALKHGDSSILRISAAAGVAASMATFYLDFLGMLQLSVLEYAGSWFAQPFFERHSAWQELSQQLA